MSSTDDLPPALPAMWRALKRGYEDAPLLLSVAFGLALLAALPDALLAVWFRLLADGVLGGRRGLALAAAAGLGVSAAATWVLRVVSERTQRRVPDQVTIALEALVGERRAAGEGWYGPVAPARRHSAMWHALAWALFGAGYVGAVVFVASTLAASPGDVLLVLAAGSRLSAYIGGAVGEIGFLRGIWLEGSRRLAWLEDYAASQAQGADAPVPERLGQGIRFEHVSFAYPGTERLVLDDVDLRLAPGSVVAIVGENGAGKTTLVKLLCRMYQPTRGRIFVDDVELARMPVDTWRSRLSGAFQDFFRFEFRVRQTVGVG